MKDWWWRRKGRCLVKRRYNIVNDLPKPFGLNGEWARCWIPAVECDEGVHWDKANCTNWSGPRV